MYILNKEEAQKIDEVSINKFGIDGIVLMENAGAKTVDFICDITNKIHGWANPCVALSLSKCIRPNKSKSIPKILIVAGSGNNGGDGFVIARHLFNKGFDVTVWIIKKLSTLSESDAYKNFVILQNLGVKIILRDDLDDLDQFDLIVDAIFGIGLARDIEGDYRDIIQCINDSSSLVLSVDIPSGINASSGEVMGIAVRADYTATYGYLKLGHIFGSEYCGDIKLIDISFPERAIEFIGSEAIKLITEKLVKKLLPLRKSNSHKYTNGNLLLVGGSHGKSGAIIMASKAAFRSGVGIATTITTIGQEAIVNASLDELMCVGLLDELGINSENFVIFREFLKKKTAIVFGPGIVKHESVFNLLTYLVRKEEIPLVIDANGLNLISESGKNIFFDLKDREIVLTPHIKEFSRLTRKSIDLIYKNKLEIAKEYAVEHGVTLVLKGENTIIASKNGEVYINNIGNSGMATAGTGDVLSGMIGAYLSRGLTAFDAAIVSVYLHAKSGDISSENTSKDFMNASDLIDNLSRVFKSF